MLPVFVTAVLGTGPEFLGLLEGTADSLSSIVKFLTGYLSDRWKTREPFVIGGYTVSALARPVIGFATAPWHVLTLRLLDRTGKGVRASPRDAWLASVATRENCGKVFGFHQAMDHTGAIIGPMLATGFLYFYPGHYRELFVLTVIPGLASIPMIFGAQRAKRDEQIRQEASEEVAIKRGDLKRMPRRFKYFLFTLLFFTLSNSSDAFLLLRLKTIGVQIFWIPILYAGLSLVKMTTSAWGGILSDRLGRREVITLGWFVYAISYLVIGSTTSPALMIPMFLFYGLYYGFSESPEKAYVADLTPPEHHGTAFGLYNLVVGVGSLPASLIAGFLWEKVDPAAPFYFGAALAFVAMAMLRL